MASHMSVPPQSEKTEKNKLVWIVPTVLLALFALAYLGGVVAFNFVFMPGTTLDGSDVSLRAASEVAQEKAGSLSGYQTHITGNGVDLTLTADQIDLAYDGDAYAREAIAATNPWAWPFQLAQGSRSVSAASAVVFDREALLALFEPFESAARESAATLGGKAVVFDAESGSFGLDPSITAQYLDDDALIETLSQAFTSQEAEIVLDEGQLGGEDDALHAAVDAADAYLGAAGTTRQHQGQFPWTTSGVGFFVLNKGFVMSTTWSWIILIIAGLCETGFAFCLGKMKLVTGTAWWLWGTGFAVFVVVSMVLLGKAAQVLPIGTAYPVWTGIGAVGAVILGILYLNEPLTFWRLFFIATLIGSIIGLKMVSH